MRILGILLEEDRREWVANSDENFKAFGRNFRSQEGQPRRPCASLLAGNPLKTLTWSTCPTHQREDARTPVQARFRPARRGAKHRHRTSTYLHCGLHELQFHPSSLPQKSPCCGNMKGFLQSARRQCLP